MLQSLTLRFRYRMFRRTCSQSASVYPLPQSASTSTMTLAARGGYDPPTDGSEPSVIPISPTRNITGSTGRIRTDILAVNSRLLCR